VSKPAVYLIDSSIYVFRAWFVLPDSITDRQGNPVNAVYGFSDFVYQLLTETRPHYVGFAFDESLSSSYRNEIYPDYKANRESAPEELKRQFQYCRTLLRASGLAEFGSDRYEADDLIGTLAHRYREAEHDIHIVTGDKDLAQLISERDTWWDYARNNRLNSKGIEKKFGVRPQQIADQLAIAGDKVDNIPGIPGIGMATAAKLLRKFGDIDHLLDNIEKIGTMRVRGAGRLQALVKEHQDTVRLSRRLTQITLDADTLLPDLRPGEADLEALQMLFAQLQFSPSRRERWAELIGLRTKTADWP
jgi:5'-3' exonuclease